MKAKPNLILHRAHQIITNSLAVDQHSQQIKIKAEVFKQDIPKIISLQEDLELPAELDLHKEPQAPIDQAADLQLALTIVIKLSHFNLSYTPQRFKFVYLMS